MFDRYYLSATEDWSESWDQAMISILWTVQITFIPLLYSVVWSSDPEGITKMKGSSVVP